jgi:putative membrane protein
VSGSSLPAINAGLNAAATVLLCLGLAAIRSGRRRAHATVMILATVVSAAFLACYLVYHLAVVPELGHTEFRRSGPVRFAYYALLISHVLLAMVNLPMILVTLWRAWRRDWERHRRIARWTWPVWFYVSVTGVLVYAALYHWNPPVG